MSSTFSTSSEIYICDDSNILMILNYVLKRNDYGILNNPLSNYNSVKSITINIIFNIVPIAYYFWNMFQCSLNWSYTCHIDKTGLDNFSSSSYLSARIKVLKQQAWLPYFLASHICLLSPPYVCVYIYMYVYMYDLYIIYNSH